MYFRRWMARGRTAIEAAGKVRADVRALELLLNALVAIRLLTKTGDRLYKYAGSHDPSG